MNRPDLVDRLVILNCPHPAGIARELAANEAQKKASAYARAFQQEDSHKKIKPENLVAYADMSDFASKPPGAVQTLKP